MNITLTQIRALPLTLRSRTRTIGVSKATCAFQSAEYRERSKALACAATAPTTAHGMARRHIARGQVGQKQGLPGTIGRREQVALQITKARFHKIPGWTITSPRWLLAMEPMVSCWEEIVMIVSYSPHGKAAILRNW